MVQAGRRVLEVGGEHVRRVVDAEIQLASTFEPSACGPPWATSGMNCVIPPVPVVLATPAPVRLNHVSIVNVERSSFAGSPNVTYAPLDPRSSPVGCCGGPVGVAVAWFDAVGLVVGIVDGRDDIEVRRAVDDAVSVKAGDVTSVPPLIGEVSATGLVVLR